MFACNEFLKNKINLKIQSKLQLLILSGIPGISVISWSIVKGVVTYGMTIQADQPEDAEVSENFFKNSKLNLLLNSSRKVTLTDIFHSK